MTIQKSLCRLTSSNAFLTSTCHVVFKTPNRIKMTENTVIQEGQAKIQTKGNVFYNPVQEFNRDLSITVLTAFARDNPQGISVLEALSATGLRSIRYAKEVPGITRILANDISIKAVEDIKQNIKDNGVEALVEASHEDATNLMYQKRKEKCFDAIDLDPYGCPSVFLDSAVQAVKDGGLLLCTATDMAVLAGNSPETCYSKYGSVSLRMKCCHEMALRILLKCIESHANRYGRYVEPLLSVSADFYIRVFVRVFTSAKTCKQSLSKLSRVYHCTGCGSHVLQPLGNVKVNEKTNQPKYGLPTHKLTSSCEHCGHPYHVGGPIWTAPIHNAEFVTRLLENVSPTLGTHKRIQGVLTMIGEELPDVPLYYTLEQLSGTLHVETPKMSIVRSAILNAGHRVSYTHMNKTSIKTDAPATVVWDIMRSWQDKHPVNQKRLLSETSPAATILATKSQTVVSFDLHANAEPTSKKLGYLRFQQNPLPNWGPGTRAMAMVGDDKLNKRTRNQGKRKRDADESEPESQPPSTEN